jgi:hypothetical protein
MRTLVRLETGRAWEPAPGDDRIPGTTIDGRRLEQALASVPPAVLVTIQQGRALPLAMARGLHVAARMAATETADAARRQVDHQLLAHPDLFGGWQWVARGTCAACLAMMNNATRGPGPLDGHPGCTCIKSPQLAGVQDKAHRQTGREKYDALTPEQQEAVFATRGAAKAQALREGRISLNDLVQLQGAKSWRGVLTESALPKVGAHATDDLAAAARALIERSRAVAPRVTKTLDELAAASGGQLRGVAYRVKEQGSLSRKVTTDLRTLADAGTPRTAQQVMDTINDGLRFTMELPAGTYTSGYRATMAELEAQGYTMVKAPKNFWGQEGYQGVHYLGRTPDGTRFELQFHTPQSLAAKEPSHKLYEVQRVTTNPVEHARLQRDIDNLWAPIHANPPPGAVGI